MDRDGVRDWVWLADDHNLFHAVSGVVWKQSKEDNRVRAFGPDGELSLCGLPAGVLQIPVPYDPVALCPLCTAAARAGT